jgi:RNA polymerase sigma-70 factor, ECF subfamily
MSPSKSTDLAHLTETEIIGLAQQGDAAAFEHLYKQHSRHVYAVCFRMAGNSSDAEELTQEAFLQVFRKIGSFRGDSALSTWIHRITFNIVLMRFRKKKLGEISLEDTLDTDNEFVTLRKQIGQVDLNMTGLFDRIGLNRAIAQLPAGYKKMFLLHDVEGYGHEEIAKILGCSMGIQNRNCTRLAYASASYCESRVNMPRKRIGLLKSTGRCRHALARHKVS